MERKHEVLELQHEDLEQIVGGAYVPGVHRPGKYKNEAKLFFRDCVGQKIYDYAMSGDAGKKHHYVAARAFLQQKDWEKFVWIEQYGSLDGYPG